MMNEKRKICSLSILSLLAGITGLFPVSIVLGHLALRSIKKNGSRGKGAAIGGVVLGYMQLILIPLAVVIIISNVKLEQTVDEIYQSVPPGQFEGGSMDTGEKQK